MTRHKYDLIALDLDGTLFGPDGKVSRGNIEAVRAARDAGIEVVICTGRALIESTRAIRAIDADQPAKGRALGRWCAMRLRDGRCTAGRWIEVWSVGCAAISPCRVVRRSS